MKRIIAALLSCYLFAPAYGDDALKVQPMVITAPSIDYQLVNLMWDYIKKETGAPADLPPPKFVLDWHVPIIARMGTFTPTEELPDLDFSIHVAPRTIDMWDPLMVLFGMGHEMAHYAFILKENDWKTKKIYTVNWKHHCNPKFKLITRGLAQLLWNVYHSDDNRAKMFEEVQMSCANFPQQ